MSEATWTAVDDYFAGLFVPDDGVLEAILQNSRQAGLPDISVSPNQGKFLMLMAMMQGAKTILEVGTLGGYSAVWLARALPEGGRLITLEVDPHHAAVARQNIALAGVDDRVEVREGAALATLEALRTEDIPPFDMTFIDADKENNLPYFQLALQLSRPGALIIVDNVVRDGEVIDADSDDSRVQGVRRLHEAVAIDSRVVVTALQTVGSKGYDGFSIARVKDDA